MTTSELERINVDTLLLGNLVIERSDSRVRTFLEAAPERSASIERTGPRTTDRCYIGSRDSRVLNAHLNERKFDLIVGRGQYLKRTYRIIAKIDDRYVSLRPKDIETATFLNGKPHEIEKEFGELTARSDGSVEVFWALPKKVLHKKVDPPIPTSDDILVGYAIAAAFGTSALSFTSILMGFVSAAMPG
ncbi:hypothetical protein [Nocardia fluminea]|uniref:hypothetical protein n=1 Tax=Nocardia fluminea TaxID=134984 RepID=UPI0033C4A5BD